MFCKYDDVERIVNDYSDVLFCLLYPKLEKRHKIIACIEKIFIQYIDDSPRLRNKRSEEKYFIKSVRKISGYNTFDSKYDKGTLTFVEKDNLLTSLRVYYNNEGNKPKKNKSNALCSLLVIILLVLVIICSLKYVGLFEEKGYGDVGDMVERNGELYDTDQYYDMKLMIRTI